jgi:protein SCO1
MHRSFLSSPAVRLLLVIGLASLAIATYAGVQLARGSATFHGTEYPDSPPAPEFRLVDHRGAPVSLTDFRGRAVLLFFGFSNCPDVCPITLARLARIAEEHGFEADQLEIVLITVDPERDTPAVLAEYVDGFRGRVRGVTGDPDEVRRVLREFGVFAQPSPGHDGRPALAHTTQVFGVDREGRIRVLIHADEPEELVTRDIRLLLRI